MEASTDFFISLVEANRILYDKSSSDFKNMLKKEEAWKRISRVTNMTVEGVKKRYTSLRQKYCREKQKEELNRRFKRRGGEPWVYSERLRFLDDFIKARTTYTNDANFEDARDADFGEMGLNGSNDNEIPPDDLNQEGSSNSEILIPSDVQTISYHAEDVQPNVTFELIDDPEVATAFFSEYSGEFTEYVPPLDRDTYVPQPVNHSEPCVNNTAWEVQPNQETFDTGNQSVEPDVSSHTMDSSSQLEPLPENVNQSTEPHENNRNTLLLRNDSRKRKAPSQPTNIGPTAATLVQPTLVQPTLVQPSIQSSRATTSSTVTTSSMNDALTAARQVPRKTFTQPPNQPKRPTLPSTATSSSAAASSSASSSAASSSAQDKTMDNIRHKMDSCLTAIATKVAEKPQRSPHAPFLAYLGTKLPNVPKEKVGDLEKEILNLVDSFCQ